MFLIDSYNPLTDGMVQALDPDGIVIREDLIPEWGETKLKQVYEDMVFVRMADAKLTNLQRQGRSGSYPSIEGQEAAQIGSILAIEKSDTIFPAFREFAA